MSNIEWTDITWNPTTGCTKISAGCKNCYAERMTTRLQAMGQEKYKSGFGKVVCHPSELEKPYTWKKPRMVFVNSMSDLFHEDVPWEFIKQVFKVMNDNPQHTFQILTKRANRLAKLSDQLDWSWNIWMGVSVEDNKSKERIAYLRKTKAKVKFLSLEPLLENLELTHEVLHGITWVIVGGESGPKARPMKKRWVVDIRNKCLDLDIAFFFKQWGGTNKKKTGRLLEGHHYQDYPLLYKIYHFFRNKGFTFLNNDEVMARHEDGTILYRQINTLTDYLVIDLDKFWYKHED